MSSATVAAAGGGAREHQKGRELRKRVCKMLQETINADVPPETIVDMERRILEECIAYCVNNDVPPSWGQIQFETLYKRKVALVLNQWKGTTCDTISSFAVMSGFWKKYVDEKKMRDSNRYTINESLATDQFECKKCHNRKCVFYQLQTRSADEPMTTIIHCIVCGRNWRE